MQKLSTGLSGARRMAITSAVLIIGMTAMPVQAEASPDAWQFEVTPYLFAAGLDGTLGIQGTEADVDVSFSDLTDHIDSAFMGTFTAQKGKWIFGFDGIYTKLEVDGTGTAGGTAKATTKQQIYQLTGAYRVHDADIKLDLLGAARYTRLDNDLVLTPPPISPFPVISAGGDDSWTDVVIGARVLAPFADNWSFLGYADVGAGGSDLTYQVIAGVNWQFTKSLTAKLGYRHLFADYEADDKSLKWDMAMMGAYLGLGIKF